MAPLHEIQAVFTSLNLEKKFSLAVLLFSVLLAHRNEWHSEDTGMARGRERTILS
jgi:hypothetical protein